MHDTRQLIKPPALKVGDRVGIIAPASNIDLVRLDAGCAALRRMGYEPFYLDSILEQDLYFSGSAQRRTGELAEMFERDDVRAIICARGGYGCNYLLPRIDIEKIRRNPKIFFGYSDVTTLLTYFLDAAGLVTFHGPMVTKDFAAADGIDLRSWEAATRGCAEWSVGGLEPLAPGAAEGRMYGGCLSMLVASLGTPYEIKTEGTILFLEDVGAKPYQIDRMLMQLKLAGKLDGARGLVFGQMMDCVQPGGQTYTLQEVITRVVGDLGIPVAYGLNSGHVPHGNMTLPLGVRAELRVDANGGTLTIMETAVA